MCDFILKISKNSQNYRLPYRLIEIIIHLRYKKVIYIMIFTAKNDARIYIKNIKKLTKL
jgi:hypothetical protein